MQTSNHLPLTTKTIDTINFFNDPKQILSLKKQLNDITPSIIIQYLRYPAQSDQYFYMTDTKQIQFMIVISKGYPLWAPRVHLRDCITTPGFNDCRDLLFEIIGQKWDPKQMKLKYIADQIIKFLKNVFISDQIYHIARIGRFHINYHYPLVIINILNQKQWFVCFQISQQKIKMLIVVITNTHFLLFLTQQQPTYDKDKKKYIIPSQNQIKLCRLIFQAQVGCLKQILCHKQQFNTIQLIFSTKKTYNMHLTQKPIKWKLRCRKGSNLIQKLIKTMKNYQPLQIKLDLDPSHIAQEQLKLLNQVSINQKQIYNKFNKQTIRKLNLSYQDIVEYYSSKNNPYYQVFMDKIARLNVRNDVKLIMEIEVSPLRNHHHKTNYNKNRKDSKNNSNNKNNGDNKKKIQQSIQKQQKIQQLGQQLLDIISIKPLQIKQQKQ